jgi:hypothetical protein
MPSELLDSLHLSFALRTGQAEMGHGHRFAFSSMPRSRSECLGVLDAHAREMTAKAPMPHR